jgi:NTP pyrophosphatase (non-canonical NTP hydrolase)
MAESDQRTTLGELRRIMAGFVREREWEQFHSPKNLALSLSIEVGELQEHFQWIDVAASRRENLDAKALEQIGTEMADVLAYLLALANALEIDLSAAFEAKMAHNRTKYPADQYRGRY